MIVWGGERDPNAPQPTRLARILTLVTLVLGLILLLATQIFPQGVR